MEVRGRYLEFRSSGVTGEKVITGDVKELRSEQNALNHNPGELCHRLTPMNTDRKCRIRTPGSVKTCVHLWLTYFARQ